MDRVERNFKPSKWSLLLLALAVYSVGCGGATEAAQTRSATDVSEPKPEPVIVVPEDPHLLLPESCFAAISIDLAALRSSPIFRNYTEKVAADLNQTEKRVADYIVEHTDRLVVGLVLRSKRSSKKPYSVVIGRGDFDRQQLLDIIKELSTTERASGLKPVTNSKDQKGRFSVFLDDGEIQGLILDNRTIMVADTKLTPDVLDLLTDRDLPRFVDSKLYKRINPHIALGQSGLSTIAEAPKPVKSGPTTSGSATSRTPCSPPSSGPPSTARAGCP